MSGTQTQINAERASGNVGDHKMLSLSGISLSSSKCQCTPFSSWKDKEGEEEVFECNRWPLAAGRLLARVETVFGGREIRQADFLAPPFSLRSIKAIDFSTCYSSSIVLRKINP